MDECGRESPIEKVVENIVSSIVPYTTTFEMESRKRPQQESNNYVTDNKISKIIENIAITRGGCLYYFEVMRPQSTSKSDAVLTMLCGRMTDLSGVQLTFSVDEKVLVLQSQCGLTADLAQRVVRCGRGKHRRNRELRSDFRVMWRCVSEEQQPIVADVATMVGEVVAKMEQETETVGGDKQEDFDEEGMTFVRCLSLQFCTYSVLFVMPDDDDFAARQEQSMEFYRISANRTAYGEIARLIKRHFGEELLPVTQLTGVTDFGRHLAHTFIPLPRLICGVPWESNKTVVYTAKEPSDDLRCAEVIKQKEANGSVCRYERLCSGSKTTYLMAFSTEAAALTMKEDLGVKKAPNRVASICWIVDDKLMKEWYEDCEDVILWIDAFSG